VLDGDPCTIFASCVNDYEAYGVVRFNDTVVRWNKDCDGHELCGGAPRYTEVDEGSSHDWADMSLQIVGEGSFAPGNNVIRVPVRDGEPVFLYFHFMDHDDGGPDDEWCGFGRRQTLLERVSLAELPSLNEDKVINDASYRLGGTGCDITLHLRGIPGSP
jgi:hypothetical protein